MYIQKNWKFYKQSLVELTTEETLSLSIWDNKKLELEKENLGRPTNPEIKINSNELSESIPQAWEHEWNWYYNWEWAMLEAKYLWKKIPTIEQWEEIVKDYWSDWEKLSKDLNLTGYRSCTARSIYSLYTNGSYWSSSNNSNGVHYLNLESMGITPRSSSYHDYGFSVRCLINN